MNFKGKSLILVLIFLVFISVSAVSAADNATDVVSDGDDYDAEIVAEDYTADYQSNDQLYFDLDPEGVINEDVRFNMVDQKTGNVVGLAYYVDGQGYGFVDADVGNYNVTITPVETTPYKIKPATINVKIAKAPVKVTAYKWVSTTKQYATLKVVVRDEECNAPVQEGTVKFTINGKTYTVKVKNGVATKRIKLTNAKTYTYKATFSSKNFKSKTVSSKVYVKKAKSYYILKYGKYSVRLYYSKYVKLLDAKNNRKYGYADVDTGIKRPPEIGGGHYYVGISTHDEYFTYYGYPMHDYIFLRASSYLGLKKVDLYTLNL